VKYSRKNKANIFFSKSIWGVFYNPFYIIRKELYKGIQNYSKLFQGKILDLGCGTMPYKLEFCNVTSYIGMDIEVSGNGDTKSQVDIFYDGKEFPFENNSIDGVFSSETFEHIFNLEEILLEINRVLKPEGLLLATCPFFWPEHEIPYDYARYTSFGLKNLLKKCGFEIVAYDKTGNYFIAMVQMQALYLYFFINKIPFFSSIFFILFISPIFILGSILNKLLPGFMKRKDLYLNNIILVKKIT